MALTDLCGAGSSPMQGLRTAPGPRAAVVTLTVRAALPQAPRTTPGFLYWLLLLRKVLILLTHAFVGVGSCCSISPDCLHSLLHSRGQHKMGQAQGAGEEPSGLRGRGARQGCEAGGVRNMVGDSRQGA